MQVIALVWGCLACACYGQQQQRIVTARLQGRRDRQRQKGAAHNLQPLPEHDHARSFQQLMAEGTPDLLTTVATLLLAFNTAIAPSSRLRRSMPKPVTKASRMLPPIMPETPLEVDDRKAIMPLPQRAAAQVQILLEQAKSKMDCLANGTQYNVVQNLTTTLEQGLIEREGEVRLLVLALLGGEHLLLLGPPGTAKSELCRRLSTLAGLTYFERTLTRFSTPEELFGPLSLSALERDEFKRATAGYMPDAQIVFIDEIFKSNSAILNTLLTLLNERLFDEGSVRRKVPLLSAVAASNEGPESEELAALYDRFLLRKAVIPVSDDGVVDLLLQPSLDELQGIASNAESAAHLDTSAFKELLFEVRDIASRIEVPRWAALLLRDARTQARERGFDNQGGAYVSDRRLRKAAELLKSSAAAHGRGYITVMDAMAVLPNVLWDEITDVDPLSEWIEDHVIPEGEVEQLRFLLNSVRVRAASAYVKEDAMLTEDARALSEAALEATAEMRAHKAAIESIQDHLFLPPQQAAGMRQRLLPEATVRASQLETLAVSAVEVQLALKEGRRFPLESEDEAPDEEEGPAGAELLAKFSDFELSWERKKARRNLSPDDFRDWKKAVKLAQSEKPDPWEDRKERRAAKKKATQRDRARSPHKFLP